MIDRDKDIKDSYVISGDICIKKVMDICTEKDKDANVFYESIWIFSLSIKHHKVRLKSVYGGGEIHSSFADLWTDNGWTQMFFFTKALKQEELREKAARFLFEK